jgi:hypothetical protein
MRLGPVAALHALQAAGIVRAGQVDPLMRWTKPDLAALVVRMANENPTRAEGCPSPKRRVFREREMGPCIVITGDVSGKRASQMRFVEDDHEIETLAANGSDQAFRVWIARD